MLESVAAEREQGRERALSVFAFLWAVALLFEYAGAIQRSGPMSLVALIIAARLSVLWIVSRPSAVNRLLLLCVLQIAIGFERLPKGPNHGMLILVAAATMLFAALCVAVSTRSVRLSPAALYAAAAPALRWQLLALYFWGVVQKLNTDFFVMDLSCGPAQVWNLQRVVALVPDSEALARFAIHGTLLVEAGIPLLLLLRRTRYLGIALAMGFHFTLGTAYTGFSAMLFAMFSLFLPDEFYAALWKFVGRVSLAAESLRARLWRAVDRSLSFLAIGSAAVAFGIGIFAAGSRSPHRGAPWVSDERVLSLWILYGVATAALFALCAWQARPWTRSQRPSLALPYRAVAVFPLVLFAIGLAPHLGLKNTQAFAMFSNLHTRNGETNHLLIPGSWQRWDHLSDLVTIRESSDPVLAKLVGASWKNFNYFSTYVVDRPKMERTQRAPEWQLPYLALRRRVTDLAEAGQQDVRLVYERRGKVVELDRAETDPELSSLPWIQRKLLLLRAIPDTNRGFCMW
jgi:hypothetical protein